MHTIKEKPAGETAPSGFEMTAVRERLRHVSPWRTGLQLVGSTIDRIVVLRHGRVVAWAVMAGEETRVHVVASLRLGSPDLAKFRELVGCHGDSIVCLWGAP